MDALLQGVEREQAQGHLDPPLDRAGHDIVVEEPMQHLLQDLLQPPALGREPVVERLAGAVEAVEQRASIEACRPLERLGRAVGGEPPEPKRIELDQVRPDRDLVGLGGKAVPGGPRQGLAQPRERLPEVGARLGFALVDPQQPRQLLAPVRPRRVDREVSEQRPDLAGRKVQRRAGGRAALEAAEHIEVQKRHRPQPFTTTACCALVPLLSRRRRRPRTTFARPSTATGGFASCPNVKRGK